MTADDQLYPSHTPSIDDLFTQPPSAIADVVRRAFSGGAPPEELTRQQMFWYSVASTAKFLAFTSGTDPCDVDLEWARLANMTYAYLSALPCRDTVMASWMGLKVRLIDCLGDRVDYTLADSGEVFQWFREVLTLPYDEVARLLTGPSSAISPEQAVAIATMKTGAKMIAGLCETPEFRACEDYQQWIDLLLRGQDR